MQEDRQKQELESDDGLKYEYSTNYVEKLIASVVTIKIDRSKTHSVCLYVYNKMCVCVCTGEKINKAKSCTTLFTLSTKSKPMKIMLNGTELQHTDSATYLGITFDKR